MDTVSEALIIGTSQVTFALSVCVAFAVIGRATTALLGISDLRSTRVVPGNREAASADQGESDFVGYEALALFLWCSAGAAVATALLFLLGLVGALRAIPVTLGLTALCVLASLFIFRVLRQPVSRGDRFSPRSLLPIPSFPVSWMFLCLLTFLTWWAVRPPGMWDDTSYHLPYARHYLEQGGIVMNPDLRFPLFPHNAHLWFAVGLLTTGSDVMAQVFATAIPTALTALGVFGLGTVLIGSRWAGFGAVALLLWAAPLREALGYAYVDHLLMWFTTATLACLVLAAHGGGRATRWMVLCGLMAGTAAGTKTFGALVSLIVGLIILFLPGLSWRAAWPYAIMLAMSGLGWYIRSWIISGDPVHPLGGSLFGHFLWNAEDLRSQHQEQATHGVSRDLSHLPQALSAAGIAVFAPAFLAPLHPRLRAPAWWGLTILFVSYTLVWHVSTQVARYMSCVLPVGALLTTAVVWQLLVQLWAKTGTGLRVFIARWAPPALTSLGIVGGALCVLPQYLAMTERLDRWQAELGTRSGYEIMRAASSLRKTHGSILVQVGFENAVYFFEGTAVGDWFGPGRYSQMLICAQVCSVAPSARMAELLRERGARMLAVNASRFKFEPAAFSSHFEVLHRSKDGYLLALKPL